ncbi:MAG: type III toxin-antitoxin system TenpIN family toxin [Candidatus Gastranaerophilaceae bacterium]
MEYPEILHKPSRPYVMLLMKIDGLTFAIPIRSHLNHKFGFITNKTTNAGLDYTKAIIILNQDYIANIQRITITKEEMMMISSYKDLIIKDFKRFLNTYKRKIKNNLNENLLKFTSLQYFQRELGL